MESEDLLRTLGGTVKSCAFVEVYPSALIMVGRNRLKLYNGMSKKNHAKQQNNVFGLMIAMRTCKLLA